MPRVLEKLRPACLRPAIVTRLVLRQRCFSLDVQTSFTVGCKCFQRSVQNVPHFISSMDQNSCSDLSVSVGVLAYESRMLGINLGVKSGEKSNPGS